MSLPPKLQEFMDGLAFFPERQERIQALISVAEKYRAVPEEIAAKPYEETHRVKGCESEAFVWVCGSPESVTVYFAVENPQGVSAMALAAILKEGLDGESASSIQQVPEDIVYDIFGKELSMGKTMGLTNMVRMVKSAAKAL